MQTSFAQAPQLQPSVLVCLLPLAAANIPGSHVWYCKDLKSLVHQEPCWPENLVTSDLADLLQASVGGSMAYHVTDRGEREADTEIRSKESASERERAI